MDWTGIAVVIFIAAVVVAAIVIVVVFYNRREEKTRCYQAAANIVKEKYLREQLTNPMSKTQDKSSFYNVRMMVFVKNISTKPKKGYIFDAVDGVSFGRKNDNNIILSEAVVSGNHCRIYAANDGKVYISDSSSNGTLLKRGLNSVTLNKSVCAIENGDIVTLGSTSFKISLFLFDGRAM